MDPGRTKAPLANRIQPPPALVMYLPPPPPPTPNIPPIPAVTPFDTNFMGFVVPRQKSPTKQNPRVAKAAAEEEGDAPAPAAQDADLKKPSRTLTLK
jgi:hypothetical protein